MNVRVCWRYEPFSFPFPPEGQPCFVLDATPFCRSACCSPPAPPRPPRWGRCSSAVRRSVDVRKAPVLPHLRWRGAGGLSRGGKAMLRETVAKGRAEGEYR